MSNNIPICDPQQARSIDQKAIQDYKIPSLILMEHAAQRCVEQIKKSEQSFRQIVVVCGPGNNGGDGFAIARLLWMDDYPVQVIHCDPSRFSIDEKAQFEMCRSLSIPLLSMEEDWKSAIASADCIVDALFGNGLSREVSGIYRSIIEWINAHDTHVISVDIPSGLDGKTGTIFGVAIQADRTIALECLKWGELIGMGPRICGQIEPVTIGIPSDLYQESDRLLTHSMVRALFPKRDRFSHKGNFGKALMIGGSYEMPGAIAMAANACFHSGIGLLSVYVPASIQSLIETKMSFVMSVGAPETDGRFAMEAVDRLSTILPSYTLLSIGNGMHKSEVTDSLLVECLDSDLPLLVDADAIVYLGKHLEAYKDRKNVIVTPHLKEMADLLQVPLKEIESDPVQIARSFSKRYPGITLVLKSSTTIIASDQKLYCLYAPDSALSKGGSGDTLTGILLGLWGWFHDPLKAALVGVYVHSQAAASSSISPISFTPNDLVEQLSSTFHSLE